MRMARTSHGRRPATFDPIGVLRGWMERLEVKLVPELLEPSDRIVHPRDVPHVDMDSPARIVDVRKVLGELVDNQTIGEGRTYTGDGDERGGTLEHGCEKVWLCCKRGRRLMLSNPYGRGMTKMLGILLIHAGDGGCCSGVDVVLLGRLCQGEAMAAGTYVAGHARAAEGQSSLFILIGGVCRKSGSVG